MVPGALLFRPFLLGGARCSQPLGFHGPHRCGPATAARRWCWLPLALGEHSPSQPAGEPGNHRSSPVVPVPGCVLIGCRSSSVADLDEASLLLEATDQQIRVTADLGDGSCRNLELLSGTFIDSVCVTLLSRVCRWPVERLHPGWSRQQGGAGRGARAAAAVQPEPAAAAGPGQPARRPRLAQPVPAGRRLLPEHAG